jgi:hypothetical protein
VLAKYCGVWMKLSNKAATNPAAATATNNQRCLTIKRQIARKSIVSSSAASDCAHAPKGAKAWGWRSASACWPDKP